MWILIFLNSVNNARSILAFNNKRKLLSILINSRHCSGRNDFLSNINEEIRRNSLNIQMLYSSLRDQIFTNSTCENFDQQQLENCINALKQHGLWGKDSPPLPPVNIKLPNLCGKDLDEHFRAIAKNQCSKYIGLGNILAESRLPNLPEKFNFQNGWTKYNADGTYEVVDFPNEDAIVFDVEVLTTESSLPVLASAVSSSSWYSWCSSRLVEHRWTLPKLPGLIDLIPLETKAGSVGSHKNWREKLVVGHNVSYDRARIKEQYFVKATKTRFVDTMSLHIATSGLTSLQRALLISERTGSKTKAIEEAKAKLRYSPDKSWMDIGSLNNLSDVYKLYCDKSDLKKEVVETFLKGQISDVRNNFQSLMNYCASDVKATFEVFQVLWPLFFERFPHPVTFAGMLEMSVAYLPVNNNWQRYIDKAQTTFSDLENELKLKLMRLANDACELLNNSDYKNDVWLWDLDWTVNGLNIKKTPQKGKSKPRSSKSLQSEPKIIDKIEESQPQIIEKVLKTKDNLYVKRANLPGYPAWFRQLCPKHSEDDEWIPGPTLISSRMQVVPKLLRLSWSGYPLHYSDKNGWGYLVPGKPKLENAEDDSSCFPYQALQNESDNSQERSVPNTFSENETNFDLLMEKIVEGSDGDIKLEDPDFWNLIKAEKKHSSVVNGLARSDCGSPNHTGNGPYLDEDVHGCWFYRLPHKNGPNNRVGNPLAKEFMNQIEDDTLSSNADESADWALKLSKMISYWRNAHKRITSQLVIWLKKGELPRLVSDNNNFEPDNNYGAILPTIVTAGTVTRRAVESTWMTASNAYEDRVGSELKSMIQAFPGYKFVGADVDSQELWIAALLGDAHCAGLHGCTPFGWMTLQGKKSQETDMHSLTATTAGISRDQAKIINYGRIYGAGEAFASRLLVQFNHLLSEEEAKSRARKMYATTKGVRSYILNDLGIEVYMSAYASNQKNDTSKNFNSFELTRKQINQLLRLSPNESLTLFDIVKRGIWSSGTESAMFNKLENIALSPEPKTPVLGCQISRALEPAHVMNNFITSRVNWVVQSSAVDYLHLMLVSMKWLFETYNIEGRFSISIHDEVRYLVKTEDSNRAALALQITNLLTRSMFAFKLGMNDLPQSVAFFSSVDIDTVLRKEVHLDCKTPSNNSGLENGYGIPPGMYQCIMAALNQQIFIHALRCLDVL